MSTKSKYYAGALTFWDPAKKNLWMGRECRYRWHDDFDTYTSIVDDGSRANGSPWVSDITGSGPPTNTLVADGSSGIYQAAHTSTSEAQDATIHFDDNRHVDLDKGAIFQAYARLTVLPTLLGIAHVGLASDHNAGGILGTTYNVGFIMAAGGAVSTVIDDNATQVTTATGVTMTVNEWYAFRIESFSKSAIRWYINGAVVGVVGVYAGTAGANSTLQPFLGTAKASGAGVGTLQVDSVDVWMD